MKVKQKCLSLLLALTMVLGTAFSTTAFAETDGESSSVEPSVAPATDWEGPAGKTGNELSDEEEFIVCIMGLKPSPSGETFRSTS